MKEQNLNEFENEMLENLRHQKIYCIIKSVSKSGMTRRMVFYFQFQNELYYLNDIIAKLTNFKNDKNGYLIVKGCGMDMVFYVLNEFNKGIFEYKKLKSKPSWIIPNNWILPNNYRLL